MPDDNRRDVAALERERLDADRRYNDALTALDRALVHPRDDDDLVAAPPTGVPELPRGWRGPILRAVHAWLAPLFAEQHAFNARVAADLAARSSRARAHDIALERFETALIVFLQQITAFVDTKVRVLDASAAARADEQDNKVGEVADLRAQVATLQRIVQALKRDPSSSPAAHTALATPAGAGTIGGGVTYVGFEDRFRGTDDEIREKQAAYLPVFAQASDVLDIGCGRGEFLALLASKGVGARGIDVNAEMVAVARDRGLDATVADALGYASRLADESLGGIMCAQVVEHLEPSYLVALLETLSHKLRAGAPVVIETINPACWLAFFSSYIRDPTHVRPVHPDTLEYLLHASGFGRVSIRYSAPVPEAMKMRPVELAAEILSAADPTSRALTEAAQVINANAAIINSLLFTHLDYAAITFRS